MTPAYQQIERPGDPPLEERMRGSIIAGAVGDALGAAVEFQTIDEIRKAHGPAGVTGPLPAYGQQFAITDDTQMLLFTAEGLIRCLVRFRNKGIGPDHITLLDRAYRRWLHTQGEEPPGWDEWTDSGWLHREPGMHSNRAPGYTCLSAVRDSRVGKVGDPLNDSKGCGTVMRIAPVGLLEPYIASESRFEMAADIAALTHGHPTGQVAAGALAVIISRICLGWGLFDSIRYALDDLRDRDSAQETIKALEAAMSLAGSGLEPGPEAVEELGGGWVAEEALAIAIYCSLVSRDLRSGLLLAVNHSGDSDSTGAIAGNILGAIHGATAVPQEWIDLLDQRETVELIAADWVTAFLQGTGATDTEQELFASAYPGW